MKKLLFPTLILALMTAPLFGGGRTKELSEDIFLSSGATIHLNFMAGEMRIVGTDGDQLRAHLTATCRKARPKCLQRLEKLRIVSRTYSQGVEVDFIGITKRRAKRIDFEAVVEIPRSNALDIKMGIGSLEITDLEQDLSVDMWIGEVRVHMPSSEVHSVLLDTGIGDAEIVVPGSHVDEHRPLLIGSEAVWTQGTGSARLDLDLQIGDISVWLD